MSIDVTFESGVKHETDYAMLVETDDGREVWVPFSVCDKVIRKPDGPVQLTIASWFAEREDLA